MSKSKDFYDVDLRTLIHEADNEFNDITEDYDFAVVEKEERIYWDLYKLYKILKTMDWSFHEAMDKFKY